MESKKRLPLFSGVTTNSKKVKTEDNKVECAICKKSVEIKKDGGIILSQLNWNILSEKCLEWRNIKENKFSKLFETIRVSEAPRPIHKLCRLNVIGQRLIQAKKGKILTHHEEVPDVETNDANLFSKIQSRSGSHSSNSSCIICEKETLTKYVEKLKCTENLSKIETNESYIVLKKVHH